MPKSYWTLVVLTTCPEALPRVPWWHPMDGPAPELFGFACRYYNPCGHHAISHPTIFEHQCVAMYGIEEPSKRDFICELSPVLVAQVLLVPMQPGAVRELFTSEGWHSVLAAAQFCFQTRVFADVA